MTQLATLGTSDRFPQKIEDLRLPDAGAGPLHRFDRGIAAIRTSVDTFTAEISSDWNVVRGPNGGYLAALILHQMAQRVDDERRRPRALTAHYLAVPKPGPVEIRTRLERSGRSVSWVSAELWQGEEMCVASRATFSTEWPGVSYREAHPPDVPPPELGIPIIEGTMPPFSQHYDYRSLFASPLLPRSHPSVGGWIRPKEPRSYDAPLLAALTDSWFPATFAHDPRFVMGATLDLTIHFRDYAAADRLSCAEFLLAVFTSRLATEGFFEEDGELWTSDGRLIVQSRQLALGTPLGG